jgi:hypothetical protein
VVVVEVLSMLIVAPYAMEMLNVAAALGAECLPRLVM